LRERRATVILGLVALAAFAGSAPALERFPPPDFESGYSMPQFVRPGLEPTWEGVAAVLVLAAALGVAAWIAHVRRSRRWMLGLSIFALVYFGFVREGCICPIGATGHVALALADGGFRLPVTVVLLFLLPLVAALLFGRVFCAGVCPLGAIQDIVLIRPVRVPRAVAQALSIVPFVYLGAAVLFACTDTSFIICRYDPFVGLFRLAGPTHMLVAGGLLLLVATAVGRPYCRFLCPYGALLSLVARWSWKRISITPDECVVCGLCEDACPFGAIEIPTPEGVDE